jgi:hypothetical protein
MPEKGIEARAWLRGNTVHLLLGDYRPEDLVRSAQQEQLNTLYAVENNHRPVDPNVANLWRL